MSTDLQATPGLPQLDADEVDRHLADGWTLPATLFTDPAVARLEDDVVWRQGWQVIGTVADFRRPGDFLTAQLGRFPVLVVRGKDEELHAFLNVCRHRGALVAGGDMGATSDGVSGNCSRFQCIYHGWTYGLDGKLIGAPEWKGGELPNFDGLGLHPVSVGTWGGAVFVSIAPAEPLEAVVAELTDVSRRVGYSYPFLDPEIEFAGAYEWEIPANWKVFQENNLECYHCGITHKKTLNTVCKVDGENFVNVNFANGNYIGAPLQEELSEVDPEVAKRVVETVETRDEVPFQQFWLWPTNMITFGLTLGYGVFRIYPVTADSCRMSGRLYARPSELEAPTGLEELLGEVINEDIAVSSGVQLGLRSGVREWGPLHHGREESIEWFSTQVWNHLSGSFRDSREDQAQDAGDGRRLAA